MHTRTHTNVVIDVHIHETGNTHKALVMMQRCMDDRAADMPGGHVSHQSIGAQMQSPLEQTRCAAAWEDYLRLGEALTRPNDDGWMHGQRQLSLGQDAGWALPVQDTYCMGAWYSHTY